jgi:hypothetical protein
MSRDEPVDRLLSMRGKGTGGFGAKTSVLLRML